MEENPMERNPMNCECGGALIDGKSSYRVSKKHFSLIIDNIPAFKCTRCDKVLYAEETVDKIQQLVNRLERDTKEIVTGTPSTNLYDY
jgi:YgiT-type zinc finger domain-containing protein